MDERSEDKPTSKRVRRFHWGRRRVAVYLTLATLSIIAVSYGVVSSQNLGRPIELVSVSLLGDSGNGASSGVSVNGNGNLVAFWSQATNLVPMDRNERQDVFLRNRVAMRTLMASVNTAGVAANGPSQAQGGAPVATMNDEGKIVIAFYSNADNLVEQDTNGRPDVFVRILDPDTLEGTTELVSVNDQGEQGNGPSFYPSISANGQLIAFQSEATNLVPDDTNGQADIFVYDLNQKRIVERLCGDTQANGFSVTPAISGDGNVVAFASNATNLHPDDNNRRIDVFVCDRRTGMVEIASINDAGVLGNGDSILPAINENGTVVAFKSLANNLVADDRNGVVDVFVRDFNEHQTTRVSVSVTGGDPNDGSFPPSVDFSGRFVAFGSAASNLVPSDTNDASDVFVRDRSQNLTLLVDVNELGRQANNGVPDIPPGISGDALSIGFVSAATNLAANDRNGNLDVFITRNPFVCTEDEDCPPPLVCENGFCVIRGTPTPTPTAGPDDCCQCPGPACQDPSAEGCPGDCDIVRQAACLDGMNCVTFTPTPTAGPDDCCQCGPEACQEPGEEGCPAECDVVRRAACIDGITCATFTPTPTARPQDCCQCPGDRCEEAGHDGCPSECNTVPDAVCLNDTTCATVTPTPTARPQDCCQCGANRCEPPGNDGCPTDCEIVRDAACIDAVVCATFTPTPTAGPNDCCQCTATQCQVPGASGCPVECEPVFNAVCVNGMMCATFTPTPTAGPADCCQCGATQCEAAGNDGCPANCDIVRDAVCLNDTMCATRTPTPPPTQTPTVTGGIPTSTPTFTPTTAVVEPTVTPTRPVGTITPTVTPRPSNQDSDGCDCRIASTPNESVHVPLWLAVPVALLLMRRRYRR
jgi:Tol biopolymer transport system component